MNAPILMGSTILHILGKPESLINIHRPPWPYQRYAIDPTKIDGVGWQPTTD
jgi:hypothetical protein